MLINRKRLFLFAASGVALLLVIVLALVLALSQRPVLSPAAASSSAAASSPVGVPSTAPSAAPAASAPFSAASAAEVAALPEARYDAVIPGLMPYYESTVPSVLPSAYTIGADVAVYGPDRHTPVARLNAQNFLADNTVVLVMEVRGDWALILTPSRQQLPSTVNGNAAAQTAGWVRSASLTRGATLTKYVSISIGTQTVSIMSTDGETLQSFPAGVGAAATPTPTGVVGYIQARYLDPAQNATRYPINLTSLHSSAEDEPYTGDDGGLIGVHYEATATGDISHGCVRLDAASISKINELPLGTLVQIEP